MTELGQHDDSGADAEDVEVQRSESGSRDLSVIPAEEWELAKARFSEIKRLVALPRRTAADVEESAKRLGCSRAYVYRMLKRHASDMTVMALVRQSPSGGKGKGRIAPEVEDLVADVIREVYLTKQKARPFKVVREVRRRCKANGWHPPAERTIAARIRAVSAREKTYQREGWEAARDKFDPTTDKFPEPRWPLSVVQFDHTKADIQIVDEVLRQPIGRAYLTAAIDVKTRVLLGIHLSLEAPSAASVALCLVHAVLPKAEWLRRRGIEVEADWPHGKPDLIHVDNGSDFRSEALSRGCDQHGITLEHRPKKNPKYGGTIERVLGMLMKELHQMPGTTFSNVAARGNYDSEKLAVLTFAELEKILAIVITRHHHAQIHSELRMSPQRAFEKGIYGDDDTLGRGLAPVIENEQRFLIDFLPMTRRSVQRYGIVWDFIHYYDDALRPFIDNGDKRRFIVRRDPRDISKIFFYCPDTATYLELPYRNLGRPSITLWEHRAAIAKLTAEGIEHFDEDTVFRGWEQVQSIVEESTRKSKKARRSAARRTEAVRSLEALPASSAPAKREDEKPVKAETAQKPSPLDTSERFDDIEFW